MQLASVRDNHRFGVFSSRGQNRLRHRLVPRISEKGTHHNDTPAVLIDGNDAFDPITVLTAPTNNTLVRKHVVSTPNALEDIFAAALNEPVQGVLNTFGYFENENDRALAARQDPIEGKKKDKAGNGTSGREPTSSRSRSGRWGGGRARVGERQNSPLRRSTAGAGKGESSEETQPARLGCAVEGGSRRGGRGWPS